MKRKYDILNNTPAEFETLENIAKAYTELAELIARIPGVLYAVIDITSGNDSGDTVLVRASTLRNIDCSVVRNAYPASSRPHKLYTNIAGVNFEAYCDDKEAEYHEQKNKEKSRPEFFCFGKDDFCEDRTKCSTCTYYTGKGGEYR